MPWRRRVHALDLHPVRFSVPEAWTLLPVLDNWVAHEHDQVLTAWARRESRAMLGPDAEVMPVASRAAMLARLTYAARVQGIHYSLVFFGPGPEEVVGTLNVRQVIADRKGQRLSADAVRQAFGKPPADLPGIIEDAQAEETRTELASGPALRIVRQETRRDETGRVWHQETVVWAVWPPGVGDAVVMVFLWSSDFPPEFRQQLAELAEGVAASLEMDAVPPS